MPRFGSASPPLAPAGAVAGHQLLVVPWGQPPQRDGRVAPLGRPTNGRRRLRAGRLRSSLCAWKRRVQWRRDDGAPRRSHRLLCRVRGRRTYRRWHPPVSAGRVARRISGQCSHFASQLSRHVAHGDVLCEPADAQARVQLPRRCCDGGGCAWLVPLQRRRARRRWKRGPFRSAGSRRWDALGSPRCARLSRIHCCLPRLLLIPPSCRRVQPVPRWPARDGCAVGCGVRWSLRLCKLPPPRASGEVAEQGTERRSRVHLALRVTELELDFPERPGRPAGRRRWAPQPVLRNPCH